MTMADSFDGSIVVIADNFEIPQKYKQLTVFYEIRVLLIQYVVNIG